MERLSETKDWLFRTVLCCFARPRESEQQIHICPSCRSLDSQVASDCRHGCEGIQPGADRPQTSGDQDKSRPQQPAPSQASQGRFVDDDPTQQRPSSPSNQRGDSFQRGHPSQIDDTTWGEPTDAEESAKGGPTTADESSLGGPTDADEKPNRGSQEQPPRRSVASTDALGRQSASPMRRSSTGPEGETQRRSSRPYDPAARRFTPTPGSYEGRRSSPTPRPDDQMERGPADSKVEPRGVTLSTTDTPQRYSASPRPTGRRSTSLQKESLPGRESTPRGPGEEDEPQRYSASPRPTGHRSSSLGKESLPGREPSLRPSMPSANSDGRQSFPGARTPQNTLVRGPGDENKKVKRGSKLSQGTSGSGRRSTSSKKKSLRGTSSPEGPSPQGLQ